MPEGETCLNQKTATSLLPYKYLEKLAELDRHVNMISFENSDIKCQKVPAKGIVKKGSIMLEKPLKTNDKFVNFPPVDVQVLCPQTKETLEFYESKVCFFNHESFEIILRQDFFAGNLIRSILTHNSSIYNAHVQTPIMLCLLWKSCPEIRFDIIVFTDLALLHFLLTSTSSRSKAGRELIRSAYEQFSTNGRIEYKTQKSDTVPHQKVSFHLFKTYKRLHQECSLTFDIESTDLEFPDVKPDRSLWHLMATSRLKRKISELEKKIAE